ncbi:hypothetical protein FOMPIDRAFT_1121627 [Fomitopsis schrenkii]|uniref:Thioesterase domain-containing protein n=1 Tax=Fomitopsis schrenkii TaxID=2126942 RepID=S8EC69_FOMSC|nr:hypothetical protein FOMPIDRAFT_1121627 [Fomitopsis schrenkii]
MDFISKSQLLSPAPFPNDDPASIKGNVSTEQKRLSGNVFAWHIANFPGSRVFGHSVFKDLKLTAIYIWTMNAGEIAELFEDTMSREAIRGQTICELTVTEEMLNVHHTFAGGCSAHLVDIGTFSSLLTLSVVTGIDYTGLSTALNITFHSPAVLGTQLKMVSSSISTSGRIMAARAEVYDKKTSRLLVSAVHTIAPFKATPRSKNPRGISTAKL